MSKRSLNFVLTVLIWLGIVWGVGVVSIEIIHIYEVVCVWGCLNLFVLTLRLVRVNRLTRNGACWYVYVCVWLYEERVQCTEQSRTETGKIENKYGVIALVSIIQ